MNNNLGETEKSGLSTTKGGRARATDPDRGTPSLGNPPPGWATADLAGRLTPLPPALLRRDRDRDRCSRGVRPALLLPFPFPSFSLQPSPSRPVPSRRRCSAVRRRARTPRPAPLLRRPQPLAAEPRCRRLTAVPLTPRLSRRERTARRGAARQGSPSPPRPGAAARCPHRGHGSAVRERGCAAASLPLSLPRPRGTAGGGGAPPRFPAAPAAPAPAAPAGRHGGAAARRALPLRRGRHPHRPAPGESRRGPLPSLHPSLRASPRLAAEPWRGAVGGAGARRPAGRAPGRRRFVGAAGPGFGTGRARAFTEGLSAPSERTAQRARTAGSASASLVPREQLSLPLKAKKNRNSSLLPKDPHRVADLDNYREIEKPVS